MTQIGGEATWMFEVQFFGVRNWGLLEFGGIGRGGSGSPLPSLFELREEGVVGVSFFLVPIQPWAAATWISTRSCLSSRRRTSRSSAFSAVSAG